MFSGCSSLAGPTGVVINQIKGFNRSERDHRLQIQIEDGDRTVSKNSIALSKTTKQSSTFVIKSELPDNPGQYSVGLSVNADQQRTFPVYEQTTSTEVGVIVDITPSGALELYIQD